FHRRRRGVYADLHGRWRDRQPSRLEFEVSSLWPYQPRGIFIVKRAPCPGVDSTVNTPPTLRVRSLMEIGPNRRRSNSSPEKRPAKLKPSPLSSTTRTTSPSFCHSFTTTWEACACFFTLCNDSLYI